MFDLLSLLNLPPYSLDRVQKKELFNSALKTLTAFHMQSCCVYNNMMKAVNLNLEQLTSYELLPYLPVSLFKQLTLKSIEDNEVFKVLTSSGTSGQSVSKIYLDRQGVSNQQKVLSKIISDFIGVTRLPMLIIDSPSVIKDRAMFSARGAGIMGFSIFGADRTYALHEDMTIDFEAIKSFLARHKGQKILMFGFTFMVWQHFYKELLQLKGSIDLSQAILIHGGGWKKLIDEAVPPLEFNKRLQNVCGITHVHDYYGMVEQTGTIYMQCEYGHMHTSNFSDVFIRNPIDFSLQEKGQTGIIQTLSLLPHSYPGHSLLTEDEGILLGEDDCPCGRKGKYFKILGRLKNAEIRGCSDTYATKF